MPSPFRGSASELTPQRLRGRRYRRLSRDLYVLDGDEPDLRERVAAAQLVLPDAVACLWTAAELHGLPARRDDEVHLARPRGAARSERPGVRVHRLAVAADERVLVAGVPATSGPRTWLDLAAHVGLEELVAAGDVLDRRWPGQLQSVVQGVRRRPGVVLARHAVTLVDAGADSPAETRHRLRLHAAGFTALRHGVVVHDEGGGWLARPDLADAVARVALQHDGEVHFLGGVERWRHDRLRDELTREQGWQVVQTTAIDLRRPDQLIDRVTRAYLRAAAVRGQHVLPMHLR